MNHIYKTVWNKSKKMFVVASEKASSKGKSPSEKTASQSEIGTSSIFTASLTTIASMLFIQSVIADTTVALGTTLVHNANNGVQVIDIAAANQAGISHNRFINYNVNKTGQVLNNAPMDVQNLSVMTSLAGKIRTNANLNESARLILNEVTGTQRSALNGYIEVSGKNADVVIANPYGITCSGCGFINTDNSVLTTGIPEIGIDGRLNAFKITTGDITVNGLGLDASQQSILKLIARNIHLDGQVNAQDLSVVAGTHQYDFETGQVTKSDSTFVAPKYAIDSTQLGGIYANKISLLATEQGVGVKMAGDAAANATEFVLTSAGSIELANHISAKTDLSIQNYGKEQNTLKIQADLNAVNVALGTTGEGSFKVNLTDANVFAEDKFTTAAQSFTAENTAIEAKGKILLEANDHLDLNSTTLKSNHDMQITATSLSTQGQTELVTQKNLVVTTENDITVGESSNFSAHDQIQAVSNHAGISIADNVTVKSNANISLQAENGKVDMGQSNIETSQDLEIVAKSIDLNTSTNANNTNLNAAEKLILNENSAVISQKQTTLQANELSILGQSLSDDLNVWVETDFTSGTDSKLLAQNTFDLYAKNAQTQGKLGAKNLTLTIAENLNQNGHTFAQEKYQLNANSADFYGKNEADQMQLNIAGLLSQHRSSLVSVSNDLQLDAHLMNNFGEVIANNVDLQSKNFFQNGSFSAINNLTLNTENTVLNGFTAANQINASTANEFISTGTLLADNSINVTADQVTLGANVESVVSAAHVNIAANDIKQNNGALIQATSALDLKTKNNLALSGAIYAQQAKLESKNLLTLDSSSLLRVNHLLEMEANNITAKGDVLANRIDLHAIHSKESDEITNSGSIHSYGKMQALDLLKVKSNSAILAGETYAKNLFADIDKTIDQNGEIYITETLGIDAKNINQNGLIFANKIDLNATELLKQSANTQLVADDTVLLKAQDIGLHGVVVAQNLTATAGQTLNLNGQAKVQNQTILAADRIKLDGLLLTDHAEIKGVNKVEQSEKDALVVSNDLSMSALNVDIAGQTLANNAEFDAKESILSKGSIQAYHDLSLNAGKNLTLAQSSRVIAQNDLNISAKESVLAQELGGLKSQISSNQKLTIQSENTVELNGNVTANAIEVTSQNALTTGKLAILQAQEQLDLKSKNQSVNLGGISYGKLQNVNAAVNINVANSATVQSLSGLKFSATDLTNNGVIRNSGTTELNLFNLTNNGSFLSNTYSQLSNSAFKVTLNNLKNYGLFLSNENLTLDSNSFTNAGSVISNSDLHINANQFKNTVQSSISAGKDLRLDTKKAVIINNGLLSAGNTLSVISGDLTNENTVQAQTIDLDVNKLLNNKDILASNSIDVTSATDVTNTGEIYANQLIKLDAENDVMNHNSIYTGSNRNSKIEIHSKSFSNISQNSQSASVSNIISTDLLEINSNKITNDAKILAGQANISAKNGIDKTIFNNNKLATFALRNNKAGSKLNANVTNENGATFYLDNSGVVNISGKLDNNGLVYAENGSQLIAQSLDNDTAKVVLNDSTLKVNTDYTHKGSIEAYNHSDLKFSNLVNQDSITLENSNLAVTKVLTNKSNDKSSVESIIKSLGQSAITATTLDNHELILVADANGHLSIDAENINLKENSGLISQGELSLNKIISTQNYINNLGNIFAKGDLAIGNSLTNFSNLMSSSKSLSGKLNTAYGGVVSSDRNINFKVNNFTNNFQIYNANGNITIDAKGSFNNETLYYGNKLVLDYYWNSPSFVKMVGEKWGDNWNEENGRVVYNMKAISGGGDGVDAALVTEKWYLTTSYNGVSHDSMKPYLTNPNNIAQIRSNNGSVIIKLSNSNTDAVNSGAKIVAGKDVDIQASGVNLSNQTLQFYKNRLYELEYLLLSDTNKRHSIAYRLDMTKGGTLVKDKIDSDGTYNKTNNYRDSYADTPNISFRDYHRESNVQGQFRAFLKNNPSNLAPFSKKDEGANSDVRAVISAGGNLKVVAKGLSNSSNATKAFVGNSKQSTVDKGNEFKVDNTGTCGVDYLCVNDGSTPPEAVDLPEDISVDLTQDENDVGNVDVDVALESVTETETENVVTSEKNTPSEEVIEEIEAVPSAPRVVNNNYPMDMIPKVNLKLPNAIDKYGQFIVSKKPNSEFLVESNPIYGQSADVIGSDYLRETLGISPDSTVKRLGDGRYEQELVRQQVEQITNKGTISDQKMQQYFDNAVEASKDLGFVFGKPLTSSQIKKLDKDVVWMVEKVVDGQKVLVPQVYLSYETLQSLDGSGSILEGEEGVKLTVDSLDNKESTIKGGTVIIDAKNDINNIGATIKGRDVQLTSKEGSINNITEVQQYGDNHSGSTYIGPMAGIISENTLVLDAAKDINITGAKIKAGGDAVLEAGNDINVTTIQDKRATTSRSDKTTTTVATTNHIGSVFDIGGSAYLKSGNDTVISGGEINVAGNFVADTGGDFKLLAVQDSVETNTTSSKSGFGVGGGLWGSETTETKKFDGTNHASTLNVGGVVDILSENKVVIEGSKINVTSEGMSKIHGAKGVDILDGKDETYTETKTTTTTFLKLENKSSAQADANTEDGASAEASSQTNLKLMEKSVETNAVNTKTSVSSQINSLGGLAITSDQGDVHVRGSKIDVKGALVVDGVNVIVEAGKNETTTKNTTNTTSLGLYREDKASASASAGADASVASANAQAGANAELSTTTTLGLMSTSSESDSKLVTNNLSSLKGGTITITAQETAHFEGADVRAKGKIRVEATDIENIAVQDTYESNSTETTKLAGLYKNATASASVGASAGASVNALVPAVTAGGSAEAKVAAEVSGGLRYSSETTNKTEDKVTNIGNTFVSEEGDFERIATNSIVDEMTSITASNGVIRQSAKTVTDRAVYDKNEVTSKTTTQETRVGVYAGVEAGVSAEAGANSLGVQGANAEIIKPDASAGIQASYSASSEETGKRTSVGKSSTFTAQNIESDVSGHMDLEGTNFNAVNKVTLNAGSLSFKEVVDTVEETKNGTNLDVSGKVGLVGTPSAEIGFGIGENSNTDSSRVGRGGEVNANTYVVNVTGKMETTGLAINAENTETTVGELKTNALTNTQTSESSSIGFGIKLSDEGMELDLNKDGYNSNLKIKENE